MQGWRSFRWTLQAAGKSEAGETSEGIFLGLGPGVIKIRGFRRRSGRHAKGESRARLKLDSSGVARGGVEAELQRMKKQAGEAAKAKRMKHRDMIKELEDAQQQARKDGGSSLHCAKGIRALQG